MTKRYFLAAIAAFLGIVLTTNAATIDPANPNILYTGRIQFSNPSRPVFSHVGCSIKINFIGTGVSAIFNASGTSYLYVILDDVADIHNRRVLKVTSTKQAFELAADLPNGRHSVEIVKINQYDTKVYFYGFNVNGDGLAEKPTRPPLALEFYGDSNAAGQSAWDPNDSGTAAVNGGYFTFPAITARMLNAEYSNISGGGAGVTSQGWWNLVDYYNLYHMNDSPSASNIWDFKNNYWHFSPAAVIVNLGANDYYNQVSKTDIKNGWKSFVTTHLRVYYPNAHIVLVNSYGWAYNEPADYVQEAVEELKAAGDDNVSYLKFPWLWSQAHAVVCEHAGFANLLAAHLAQQLGLPQPEPNQLSCFAPKGQVANGSFEKSVIPGAADGWRSGNSVTLITDPTPAFDGEQFLHIKSHGRAHYANDAAPGETFQVTAWMRATSGDRGQLKIEFKDQSQKIIKSGTVTGLHDLTQDWQLVSTIATAPAESWQVNVVLSAPSGSAIDVDNVKMQYSSAVLEHKETPPPTSQLFQNYPNPFNPSTEIKFQLSEAGPVVLQVFSLLGQKIATLLNAKMSAGLHRVHFDGSGLASGIYYYQIQTESFVQMKKCLLLR